MRGGGVIRGGVVTCLALLAAAAPAHAQTAGSAEPRFGISVNRIFNDTWFDQALVDRHLAEVRAAGIRLARTDAFWMAVEHDPPEEGRHTYRWGVTDFAARNLTRYGQQWLPILDYSALWAGTAGEHSPPTDLDDYAAYARAFAERYGRGGRFWELHPELDYMPVTTYEVWNEPNGAWFWRPEPDPELYADMYARARAAIKAVDPEAVVMIGGLVPGNDYVRSLFRALDASGTEADAIGFHPYATTSGEVLDAVRSFRATLDALGQVSLPIYITEVGWPTSGAYANVQSDADRAAYLTEVADALARSDCGIRQVIPYTWTTPARDPGDSEDWYGIYRWEGGDTLTSAAYADLVRAHAEGPAAPAVTDVCDDPPPSGQDRAPAPEATPAETPAEPAPAPAPDMLPPEVALRVPRHRLARLVRRGARASISCSEACEVTAVLSLSAATVRRLGLRWVPKDGIVGRASRALPGAIATAFSVELSPWARRALARAHRLRLRLTVVAADGAGNSRSATAPLVARRR